ncbi:MAG: GspH/FimT family pseudopilin [Candidatus Rokuibacteriota bacterium]
MFGERNHPVVSGVAQRRAQRGFTAAEVLVVMAIVGIMALVAIPTLFSYSRASTVKAAAEEMVAGLNSARHLAIVRNRTVCLEVANANQYRFWLGSCGAGTVWTGPETGANGFVTLGNDVTVTTTANPVFDRLGAAPTQATFTISNADGATRSVVVAASGRVTK